MEVFEEEHWRVLETVLRRAGLLREDAGRPEPFLRASGAGQISTVYGFFAPSGSHETGRILVAKFDKPSRQIDEWKAIDALRRMRKPPGILLPIDGNSPGDGVIVFDAAQSVEGHFRCLELQDLLKTQAESNPENCVAALRRAFSVLASFYDAEPGAPEPAAEGRLLTWARDFPYLCSPESKTMRAVRAGLSQKWSECDWDQDVLPPDISQGTARPNPLHGLVARLDSVCGPVMLSRVHGDLNLGNILISLRPDRAVSEALIIDVKNSEPGRLQATDFARVEVEYWRHVYTSLYAERHEDGIREFLLLRDYLDGREHALPDSISSAAAGSATVIDALRSMAWFRLNPNLRDRADYALEDYFHCLLFHSVSLLKHDDVQASQLVTHVLFLSASLARQYLCELDQGLYERGSVQRRWLPPRRSEGTPLQPRVVEIEVSGPVPQQDQPREAAANRTFFRPPAPSLCVGREEEIAELKHRLLQKERTGLRIVALHGIAGVGKTTLARALAHDDVLSREFPGGIYWTSIGPDGTAEEALASWADHFDRAGVADRTSLGSLLDLLGPAISKTRSLLVVDDVWSTDVATPFKSLLSDQNALLLTTRQLEVARGIEDVPGRNTVLLRPLTPDAGLDLLRELAPQITSTQPTKAKSLIADVEGLPLAIRVAGRLLVHDHQLGLNVEPLLDELRSSHRLLDEVAPDDRFDPRTGTTPTIRLLFERSTDRLDPTTRRRFAHLAAFAPKPAAFDADDARHIWSVVDVNPTLRRLVEAGLLEPVAEAALFQIHALLAAHARTLLSTTR